MDSQKNLMLNFTLRIPGSDNLKDSRYTTCMDLIKHQTRYVTADFKNMVDISAQGSCPQLSTNEDDIEEEPLYKGFFCPPGLKLKEQKDNNLCCKCYRLCKAIRWSCMYYFVLYKM